MAYVVMAYPGMAYTVMAYTVMACGFLGSCRQAADSKLIDGASIFCFSTGRSYKV